MITLDRLPESPLQTIHHPLLKQHNITLVVKRDDLLHPLIQGNKWRKLKYNLLHMQQSGVSELVTFGGAFSNHLYATAMACKTFAITGHAIIRGPQLDENNPTIKMARACGLSLHPVTRIEYRQRHQPDYLNTLQHQFPDAFIIPEGGSNSLALNGVKELAQQLPKSDYVMTAVGSGGTLAGLAQGLTPETQLIGVAVLKGAEYLAAEIRTMLDGKESAAWHLEHDFHHGGYAKVTPELLQFCHTMKQHYRLPLEPIYTGKLFYALFSLVAQGQFPSGATITAIHTGGLQGLDGLRYMNSMNVR